MRYLWIRALIRIFADLNKTKLGSVNASSDVICGYYGTLVITQVVNGTRYIPVITYVYWKNTRTGSGYWMASEMGRGIADYFDYLTAGLQSQYKNQSRVYDFETVEEEGVLIRGDPSVMIAHWSNSGFGRSIYLNKAGVEGLRQIGGSDAGFCTTAYAPGGSPQGSIDYTFWPYNKQKTVNAGTLVRFWTVIFDFRSSGPGFGNYSGSSMWKNAYIYAPMFLENYAPTVVKP